MNTKVEAMLRQETSAGSRPVPFTIRNLSVLAYANNFTPWHYRVGKAYANGFTLWHYKAGKATVAQVKETNFFFNAANMLAPGDMILVSAADGAKAVSVVSTDPEVVVLGVVV